jgi:hypothetical protein
MGRKMTKPISQQLRDAIEASELSRYRICKEIELSESTMSHFMAGKCGLQLSTIDRLGRLLSLRIVSDLEHRSNEGR